MAPLLQDHQDRRATAIHSRQQRWQQSGRLQRAVDRHVLDGIVTVVGMERAIVLVVVGAVLPMHERVFEILALREHHHLARHGERLPEEADEQKEQDKAAPHGVAVYRVRLGQQIAGE
jgi:hypothetical protein